MVNSFLAAGQCTYLDEPMHAQINAEILKINLIKNYSGTYLNWLLVACVVHVTKWFNCT